MVFRTRPFRQSVFLSSESASVSRAEFQQDIVDLIPRLASAKCINCKVVDDTIYFGENGVFELDVTPFLPSLRSILSLVIDRSRAPVGLSVDYEIALRQSYEGLSYTTLYGGRLVVLDPSDTASEYTLMLTAPVAGGPVLRLSASGVALPLKYLGVLAIRTPIDYSFVLPFPRVVYGDILSMWRLPIQPARYIVFFFWNSTNGNTATLTYGEAGVDVATFSTTSTATLVNSINRVWRRDVFAVNYSASSNAVVKALLFDFFVWLPALPVRALQASYSTTSTSYVQYTPLSLSAAHARIRRIVVSASNNARWYVNVGNTVLRSEWGINSLDFNPPVEATRVDFFLASADGANATASIVIIYDEVPARL